MLRDVARADAELDRGVEEPRAVEVGRQAARRASAVASAM
jgi:hypothetical protein